MKIDYWRLIRVLELTAYAACIAVSFARIPRLYSVQWWEACDHHSRCRRFLRKDWLGGTLDTADDQWRELRQSLPLLCAAILIHTALSMLLRAMSPQEDSQARNSRDVSKLEVDAGPDDGIVPSGGRSSPSSPKSSYSLPMGRLGRRRLAFSIASSVVFLAVMHGYHAVFPVVLVCVSYSVGHLTKGTRWALPCTWATAILFIWIKEYYHGAISYKHLVWDQLAGLDTQRGLHPWRLSFNLAILRIVSFNVDLHWAEVDRRRRRRGGVVAGRDQPEASESDERVGDKHGTAGHEELDPYKYPTRVAAHRPLWEYSLWHCLSYVFYAPLYLAGPTITFNAYVSHMACPQRSYGGRGLLAYLGRLLFAFWLLEAGLRTFPVFALARSGLLSFGAEQLAAFAYVILKLVWLKFLVIWRLFRLWALCDGVEPPENMKRCMSNNYSVSQFWKGWHCSFNRWLVRYIYVPLGGAKPGRWWNIFVVFIFVALWHDVEPKLFVWGLLNGVFLVLEMTIKGFYRRSSFFESCRANHLANRMVQGLGATSTIMALFLVNLIGYTMGIAGTRDLVDNIARDGQIASAVSFAVLFSGVQIMFAIEDAKSRGKVSGGSAYRKVAKS